MMAHYQGNNIPFLVGAVIGAVFGIFLVGYLLRLSVRIVARFTPSYGMVYVAMIVAFLACIATGFVAGVVEGVTRLGPPGSLRSFVAVSLICFVVTIAVYGQVIKAPSGEPLGFIKALLAYILQVLLHLVISAALAAVVIGVFGYQRVANIYRQQFANYLQMQRSLRAQSGGFHFPAASWPGNVSPSMQATPAPDVHYYLKSPLVVRVSYGTITIPARTEVRLIDQTGDSCQIQVGNDTYTVSSSQLGIGP